MNETRSYRLRPIPALIFASRWLQLPLYLGLIVAQGVYVWQFWKELVHLLHIAAERDVINETQIMLVVLGLIDVVMIANLLIMVIVGGYETFVSRLYLEGHPDQPEWLSHVNAAVLKVKLATAIIGISSIHLLKSFINADQLSPHVIYSQVGIHLTFLLSALAVAATDRLLAPTLKKQHGAH
ncbi:MAG TPA: TIGR00645 family protein [Burkholderiales bacterium]|nr:TIGR00645 family protein [Betaproteobacteria bacterium]HQR52995.1 TIGR00645 family protein [Burkholderiales bacterium]